MNESDITPEELRLLQMLAGAREKTRTEAGAYAGLIARGLVRRVTRTAGGFYLRVTDRGMRRLGE